MVGILNPGCLASALRDTIATDEGTAGAPDSGYGHLVGGTVVKAPGQFSNLVGQYSRSGLDIPNPELLSGHPHILVQINSSEGCPNGCSSAFGRYQILAPSAGNMNFTPASQDNWANRELTHDGALAAAKSGDFVGSMADAGAAWQSLPGSNLGRQQKKMGATANAFLTAIGNCK